MPHTHTHSHASVWSEAGACHTVLISQCVSVCECVASWQQEPTKAVCFAALDEQTVYWHFLWLTEKSHRAGCVSAWACVCVLHKNAHSAVKKGSLQGSAPTTHSSSLHPSDSPVSPSLYFMLHTSSASIFLLSKPRQPLFFYTPSPRVNCYAPSVSRWYIPLCCCFICPLS